MRRVLSIVCLALVCCLIAGPVGAATKAAPAEKEWTFLVFLNGHNNLDSCGIKDEKEMAKVGSNDYLNIVTLIDHTTDKATLDYIEKGKITKLKDMGSVDMGDYKVMVKFVKDMAAAYPAKHYALIIWNHGSGWDKKANRVFRGVSYDDGTGHHITTAQLTTATNEIKAILGRNLDIIGYDACLMAMMEVAYAVKGSVDYVVNSEETEPGDGYPYDTILAGLKKGMSPADFCKIWIKAYADSYNGGVQGTSDTTQSAVECSKLDALKDAIDALAKVTIAGKFADQYKTALNEVQKFYYESNIDLGDLVKILQVSIKDAAFQDAAKKLQSAYAAAVVANATSGDSMKNATGLAIYFPVSSYSFSSEYAKLAYAKDGMWDELVQDYYKKTTSAAIVADVEKSEVSSLMSYVKTANENNREVSADLIAKLNFRVFSEGGLKTSVQENVKNMVLELKKK